MLTDPFHWFPSLLFEGALVYGFILFALIDSLLPRFFSKARRAKPVLVSDQWSSAVIYMAEVAALVVGSAIRYFNITVINSLWQYGGLVVVLAGFFFRAWAILTLGRFFSRVIEIESEHKLITEGPYRWIRHPSYTGIFLILTGINLGLGTWLGTLLGSAMLLSGMLYRINVEEKVLLQNFGDEYRLYRERTWMLFPGI